jgi:hypothetical protein
VSESTCIIFHGEKLIKNLCLVFLLLFLIQIKYLHKQTSRHYLNYLKNSDYLFWTLARCGGTEQCNVW